MHLLGSRPYSALPEVLRGADAALVPYAINDLTRSVFPMKVFEYLAAGLPVVTTPLPALAGTDGVAVAADAPSTVAAVERALAEDGPDAAPRALGRGARQLLGRAARRDRLPPRSALRERLKKLARRLGYEVRVYEPLRSLAAARAKLLEGVDVVVDVGANAGQYGVILRELGYGGRIVSLEPVAEAFAELEAAGARRRELGGAAGGGVGRRRRGDAQRDRRLAQQLGAAAQRALRRPGRLGAPREPQRAGAAPRRHARTSWCARASGPTSSWTCRATSAA